MYKLIKPLLFLLDPEVAHKITTSALRITLKLPFAKKIFKNAFNYDHSKLEQELFGITFKNPVGLAAGFDKNAELIDDFSHLGFGFIEVGTLTPKPQEGNKKPRLFRLPKDKALINRMGFNNEGVDKAVERLKKRRSGIVVGGNIGKNKITPNEQATDDYLTCFHKLFDHVDYFTVNVSSPNTPGLRELQEKEPLKKLLEVLLAENKKTGNPKPILLKIAPDLNESQLDDILELVEEVPISGLIVSNTTIDRDRLVTGAAHLEQVGSGGLSGAPLYVRSNNILEYIRLHNSSVPIIAVGGIMKPEDAIAKIRAGANLVQVYTGLVYEGPSLIKKINEALARQFEQA